VIDSAARSQQLSLLIEPPEVFWGEATLFKVLRADNSLATREFQDRPSF
jgi:hypothetical protein